MSKLKCFFGLHKFKRIKGKTFKGEFNAVIGNVHTVIFLECEACKKRKTKTIGSVKYYHNSTSVECKTAIEEWEGNYE
jgi:hypothetical protein